MPPPRPSGLKATATMSRQNIARMVSKSMELTPYVGLSCFVLRKASLYDLLKCSIYDESGIFFIKNRSITGQVLAVDSGQNLNWQTPDIIGTKE